MLVCVYCGMALRTDRLKVFQAPGVIVEVGIRKADDERAHLVVHLCCRGEPSLLKALLAQASVTLHDGITDRAPSRIVIHQLVSPVVLVAWLLWLWIWPIYACHRVLPFCVWSRSVLGRSRRCRLVSNSLRNRHQYGMLPEPARMWRHDGRHRNSRKDGNPTPVQVCQSSVSSFLSSNTLIPSVIIRFMSRIPVKRTVFISTLS